MVSPSRALVLPPGPTTRPRLTRRALYRANSLLIRSLASGVMVSSLAITTPAP